ncbi:MAG: hypothetical protein H0V67_00045 [Geodermatophilaceae bacterium]|nr:hypothetical protein [Geodermatophilaceae bacterium]
MRTFAAVLAVEESYEAGPTGLLVIVLLAIGIFLLGRSMIKHVRRVPASFDPPDSRPETSPETSEPDRPEIGVSDAADGAHRP